MFCCRLPSFNELDVSERIKPDSVRGCLGHIYFCLKRNKILAPQRGWMLAAVDGHETHCSYKRCCPKCLQRQIAVGDEVKTQFYHRLVTFQIICEDFQLLLDVEMLEPGEDGDPGDDEVAAAIRLITRVLKDHPLTTHAALTCSLPMRSTCVPP